MTSASRAGGRSLVYVLLALGLMMSAQTFAQQISDDFLQGSTLFDEHNYSQAAKKFEAVTAADATNEPAWYYLGLSRLYTGDTTGALEALQKAADLEPIRPGTFLHIGQIYEMQGAFEQAVAAYQEDLRNRQNRNLGEVYSALGRAYYYAGYYFDALEALDKAIQEDPNYLEAMHYRGLAHYQLADYEQSLKGFKKAVDVMDAWDRLNARLEGFLTKQESGALSSREQRQKQETQEQLAQEYSHATEFILGLHMRRDLYIARGDAADADDEWAMARNSYRDALDLRKSGDPNDTLANTKIGLAYLHEAESAFYDDGVLYRAIRILDEAIASVQKAIDYSADFAYAHLALGDVYAFQARTYVSDPERKIVAHTFGDALAEYDKALKADAQLLPALLSRARVYIELEDPAKALADLQKALDMQPRNAELYGLAAMAYQVGQDYQNAINTAATALALDPKNAEAHNAAGLAYYYLGDLGMAAEHFTNAIEADPTKHQWYTNLGNTYFQMGSWHRARQEYEKALEIIPASTVANTAFQRSYLLWLQARTYHYTGMYNKEVEVLNEALTLDPAYLDALLQLADAYIELKNYRAAETDLRLALEKSPGGEMDAQIHNRLGRLFEREGDVHQAIAQYSEALKAAQAANIENPEAQEALRRLKVS